MLGLSLRILQRREGWGKTGYCPLPNVKVGTIVQVLLLFSCILVFLNCSIFLNTTLNSAIRHLWEFIGS
ncbi:unnamed protein product [Cuscuta campestris]|uniref:Uncharacterized protein n=1 Tax=Cuscuta campestris TaxID=132261 RepID=A0A484M6I3_9ASTE|nr:unnamed protein product [Cuscuta campestris]